MAEGPKNLGGFVGGLVGAYVGLVGNFATYAKRRIVDGDNDGEANSRANQVFDACMLKGQAIGEKNDGHIKSATLNLLLYLGGGRGPSGPSSGSTS